GGEGRGVDDPAGPLALHHRDHGLAHQERALQVDVEIEVPRLTRAGLDTPAGRDPGVVDEHVDPAERLDHLADDGLGARAVPDVADELAPAPPLPPERVGDVIEELRTHVRDHRDGAFAPEGLRDLAADAAARPGDDCDL